MKMKPMELNIKNIIIYISGTVIISFGVVMMLKSTVGLSSWDTLHYSIHRLTGMTVGTAVILVALAFTAYVTYSNKNWKYLLMVIPIFAVGALIDYFNLILFVDFEPTNLMVRIFTYTLGLLMLPLGGSLLIISSFPAGVFDEFMLTMMRQFKSENLIKVRVIMELCAVLVAIVISLIVNDPNMPLGMFNVGTIIFSVSVGIFVKIYLTLFEKIGLYSSK